MSLISIDYKNVERQAKRLDELVRDLENIYNNDLQKVMSGARRNWSGSAATLYQKRLEKLADLIRDQAKKVGKNASSLHSTASVYEKIEQASQNIFGF